MAIQSWIRCCGLVRRGGSVYRSRLVRRGDSYSKTSTNVNW